MKKILLLLSLYMIAGVMSAQSVLGIPFGSTYRDTKLKLEKRLGEYRVHGDSGKLYAYDVRLGDVEFKFAHFYFQYAANESYFNEAYFSNNYDLDQSELAKSNRDYIKGILEEKYLVTDYINKYGYTCYLFGYYSSKSPLGELSIKKGRSKSGKDYLYLNLEYFPIYYADKSADF